MAHKRVKDISFDDDDFYDYDEEDYEYDDAGPGNDQSDAYISSPEEKEQLRQAVQKVKARLGPAPDVDDSLIEKIVWDNYYEIEPSLEMIQSERKKAQSKPKKAPATKAAPATNDVASGTESSTSDYVPFAGVSWTHIPPDRLDTTSTPIQPMRPTGKLLGGSGKPSKLAALAAQRKKAQADKKKDPQPDDSGGSSSVALLDRLSLREKSRDSDAAQDSPQEPPRPRQYKRQKVIQDDENEKPQQDEAPQEEPDDTQTNVQEEAAQRADLTSTANALFGGPSRNTGQEKREIWTIAPVESSGEPWGPSPDDVVLNAQSKGQSQNKKKEPAPKPKPKDTVVQGVAALKIDETPKVKSKNIDVVAEYEKTPSKNAANFVVVGHVDHGKSTLMGRLLYDLSYVDKREHAKTQKSASEIGKSSFAFAWAMDSTEEERARGITVDIATNTFETEKTKFTILDAPGHRDFIPNMIAGASQADFAVLVIDAGTNAFEAGLKGQTREHAMLVRSLGISRVVVAVNKMDRADWSEERFTTISQQIGAFLSSAGFQPNNIVFVPCAGLTGENVVQPLDKSTGAWHKGGTLVDALDGSEPARRRLTEPLRMTVSDVLRTNNPGVSVDVSVTGRLDAGHVQAGTVLTVQPSNESCTVKAVSLEGGNVPVDYAVAGQIATLGLVGVDANYLNPGAVLSPPGKDGIVCSVSFTAKCLAFEHVLPGAVEVFRGRLSSAARISELVSLVEKGDEEAGNKKAKRPRVVKPGQVARVRVVLEGGKALPLEAPDRIVLRSEGVTVAAGLVDSVDPIEA